MSAKSNNLRIGLFVLVAIALLVAGLLAFGMKSYFEPRINFETAVPGEVYGLSVGSRVELRGVPVGKVTGIDFSWNIYPQTGEGMIVVEFEVEHGVLPQHRGASDKELVEDSVRKGLRAMIKSQGVTGTSSLALESLNPSEYPPPPIDYTPKHLYIPSAPGQFTRVLESIEKSLRKIQDLNFADIGHGITNTLGHLSSLTRKLDQIDVFALSTNANDVLVEVKDAAFKLQATIDEARDTLKSMKLDAVSQNADQLLVSLKATTAKLDTVLDQVGAAPVTDTIADIREAVQTLNNVLLELKQYPSGFFLGKPPLPARSVQPPSK